MPYPNPVSDRDSPDTLPITLWLRQLEAGDPQAAQPLYDHFCTRILAFARQRIPPRIRGVYDDEDVAISSFNSLFNLVNEKRYDLHGRDDLWRLLITIAERKISRRVIHETRQKRDVHRVVEKTLLQPVQDVGNHNGKSGIGALSSREPTPEFSTEMAETCDELLALLPDDDTRAIALLKLENYTSDEIGIKLGFNRRTIQRKLLVIRQSWRQANDDPNEKSQSDDR